MIKEDIFYDIKGYEGLYKITITGVVKSLPKKHGRSEEFILKQKKDVGYWRVALHKSGVIKYLLVHRLIALHFIPNPKNKPQINHKNGVRDDNRLENLEWCTTSENGLHSYRVLGNIGSATGKFGKEAHGYGISRFADRPIRKVKCDTLDIEFPSISQAKRELGVSSRNITAICQGKRTHTHGLSFRYL